MTLFSERLKWMRNKKGYTQAKLAEMIGMSSPGYAKIENGQREPNLQALYNIRISLEETLDFFLGIRLLDISANKLLFAFFEMHDLRVEQIEDVNFFVDLIDKPLNDDIERTYKLIKAAKDRQSLLIRKEEEAYAIFLQYAEKIPGFEEKHKAKEYWIDFDNRAMIVAQEAYEALRDPGIEEWAAETDILKKYES